MSGILAVILLFSPVLVSICCGIWMYVDMCIYWRNRKKKLLEKRESERHHRYKRDIDFLMKVKGYRNVNITQIGTKSNDRTEI